MSSDDITYYRERLEVERARALHAPTPEIARSHAKLADLYEELIGKLMTSQAANDQSAELPARIQQQGE
jgi:hypothetical protein